VSNIVARLSHAHKAYSHGFDTVVAMQRFDEEPLIRIQSLHNCMTVALRSCRVDVDVVPLRDLLEKVLDKRSFANKERDGAWFAGRLGVEIVGTHLIRQLPHRTRHSADTRINHSPANQSAP
jgi:hypothetical protein